jgi:hypothetical protein
MTLKTPLIVVGIVVPVLACFIVGLLAAQSAHSSGTLQRGRAALAQAQTQWTTAGLSQYRILTEQRISNTWSDPRRNVCQQDIVVDNQGAITVTSDTCPSSQKLTIPELFTTIDGILSGKQPVRQVTGDETQYNRRPVIENTVVLLCGVDERSNYRVDIVYDRQMGYPHHIRYSVVDKSVIEQVAIHLGLLPRCTAVMSTLPEIRVISLEAVP